MSTEITPFVPSSIEQAEKLASQLAKSSLLPSDLRGKPSDILVVILTGHELGLSPMQAIRGMHVIKGKAVMSADLMVALVKKHSDCKFFKLVESTDMKATYETERGTEGKTTMSFTIEQAKQARLIGNDNWSKYPAAMLRARCASALARAVYPDLTLGVYDPDEGRELDSGEVIRPPEKDVTPVPVPEPVPVKVVNSNVETLKAKVASHVETIEEAQVEHEPGADLDAEEEDKQTPWDVAQKLLTDAGVKRSDWPRTMRACTGKKAKAELTWEDIPKLRPTLDAMTKLAKITNPEAQGG